MNDDTIYRQAAIETAENVAYAIDEHGSAEGWLAMLVNSLKFLSPAQSEITDEQAIEHLQSTGWMQNHDREMYESGLRKQLADNSPVSCDDTVSRQAAIVTMCAACWDWCDEGVCKRVSALQQLPSAQPTLNGYNIEHLLLIAELLKKENLPPKKVSDALYDIGQAVAIVKKEFEKTLREAVEQCMM